MKFFAKSVCALMLFGLSAVAYAEITPDQLVKKTADEVIEIIKSDQDIRAGDQAKIYALAEAKILPYFDFDRVCRLVLGQNWARATAEQRTGFQKEFRSLLLRTYASALSKYQNQEIRYLPFRGQPGDTKAMVKTQIMQSGGQPIGITYRLDKGSDGWKVTDLVIEDVSLVASYRDQLNNEIRQSGGMDGLIKKLAEKNREAGS